MPAGGLLLGLGAVSLIGDIYKGAQANKQMREGRKLQADLERRRAAGEFTYNTPAEAYEAAKLSKNQFMDTSLPGEALAKQGIQGNTAQAIQLARDTGRSPAEIMATISGANANQNTAYNDISVAAANRQLQDLQNYQQQLGIMGEYKDKEFAYNKWMPYMADRQYAESLIGAGNKNMYSAIDGATSAITGTALSMGGGNALGNLFGKTGGAGSGAPGITSGYNPTGDPAAVFTGGQPNRYRGW